MEYRVKGFFTFPKNIAKPTDKPGVFEYDFIIDPDFFEGTEPTTDDIRLALGFYSKLLPESTNDRPTIVGEYGLGPGGDE